MHAMPIMNMRHSGNLVVARPFENFFYIIRNPSDNTLYVKFDNETLYREVDNSENCTTGGGTELEIRIIGASSSRPLIQAVPSHWLLTIDGIKQRQRYYDRFAVPGRTISLEYNDFQFECTFSGIAVGDVDDVIRPATLR
jgi:hypothetical protein